MFMIYFLKPFTKYENSENQFSEFSLSWKPFLLNLFSCLVNSFIINDVYKNLKENVNIKIKNKHKVLKNWKTDSSSFFRIMNEKDLNYKMQLQDFKRIKLRAGMKNCFCFPFLKK